MIKIIRIILGCFLTVIAVIQLPMSLSRINDIPSGLGVLLGECIIGYIIYLCFPKREK